MNGMAEPSAEPAPSAAPPGSTSPAAAGTTGHSRSPTRPPRSRRVLPVIVVAVVGIVLSGFRALTLAGPGDPGNGSAPPYSLASQAANKVAAGASGGPWDLVVAAGVHLEVATTAAANGTVGSGCTYTSPEGGPPPPSVFVPRYEGSFSAGGSPWWGMIYFQPTSHEVLLVEVVNGSAYATVVASGSCTSTFQNYTTIPANVVDSPTAASAAWRGGGSTFLSTHSNESFNVVLALLGGGSACVLTSGPCWLIEYTPCDPLATSNPVGSQPVFYALVNGATGVLLADLPSSSTCSSSGVTLGLSHVAESPGVPQLFRP